MKPVIIRDSTLREGMELPGPDLSLDEKIQVVRFFEEMNVPEVEIGMPYGIKDCVPLASRIKSEGLKIRTSALVLSYSPTWREEINIAADSGIDRIEILFPSSDILLTLKEYYKIHKEDLPGLIQEAFGYAKEYMPKKVGVGFVDSSRTAIDFLAQLTRVAQDSGADRAIIYDSIGIATPSKIKNIICGIKKSCSIPIIIHCHDDLGLATANSIMGIEAGAEGVDVVVNGLGDRGGNAAFEEVVLALEILYGIKTGIKLNRISELSKLVEDMTGIKKCPVKPVVGDFAFLHSPVMHIRNAASGNYKGFEPFEPELIGAERKYAFTLPVDYSAALEPFYDKLGLKPDKEQQAAIMSELHKESIGSGLSEQQVIELIKRMVDHS